MRRAPKALRTEINLTVYTIRKALGVCVRMTCYYMAEDGHVLCEHHLGKLKSYMKQRKTETKSKERR